MAKLTDKSIPTSDDADGATRPGKGRATPTRREREQANQRPLVATGKEGRRQQRRQLAEQRERARVGLANGEEKYLPERDRGPQRRFVRDWVDARYSVGEAMIPIMVVVIVMTLVKDPAVQGIVLIVLWGFLALAVIDCLIAGRAVTSRLAAKYGASEVQRGTRWYAAMRCMQMKPMRLPKPQVARRQFPSL